MISRLFSLSLGISFVVARVHISPDSDLSSFQSTEIIRRDVAIIGGGSSGTHAAITLKDQGHTVVVIEHKERMGGHTETYVDPVTATAIDYGVVVFHNEDRVKKYFARFNISMTQDVPSLHTSDYDLKSGAATTTFQFTPTQVAAAFQEYVRIISQWPELDNGMYLPSPIPEDLTMSLGAFVKKYKIEALIPTISRLNTGCGDLLSLPMVENLRVVGLSLLQTLSSGFLTTSKHVNSELYRKAEVELLAKHSLLLNTRVTNTRRSANDGVRLVVATPDGKKLIVAKKLLITIPPKIYLVRIFNLTPNEEKVFSRFMNTGYYTSVIRNAGTPTNLSIYNTDSSTPFQLPLLPNVLSILETGVSGLHTAYFGAPRSFASDPMADTTVKTAILNGIKILQSSNPSLIAPTKPEIVAYSSHAPFYLQASERDIKNGFYRKLYDLQGEKSTHWTGAAWRADDSSSLWRYNEEIVLPRLVEGL